MLNDYCIHLALLIVLYIVINDGKLFPRIFKQRLIDNYVQDWHGNIENNNVLDLYKNCKTNLSYEIYLDLLPRSLRMYISKIRLSAHSLRIQTGRYSRHRLPRNERYCQCCNTLDIEDEYHFVLVCPCYNNIRKTYIKNIFMLDHRCSNLFSYCKLQTSFY